MRDHLKQPFSNPFCWCIIDCDSMCYLIKNYETINFNNYKLCKDENWNFYSIIDGHVKVKWVHYRFSPNDKTIRIDEKHEDVLSNHIWEYITEKYETRIKRMLDKKEKPVFIIGTSWIGPNNSYTQEEINKICALDTDAKIIICNENMKAPTKNKNIIFHDCNLYRDNVTLAKQIYESYLR